MSQASKFLAEQIEEAFRRSDPTKGIESFLIPLLSWSDLPLVRADYIVRELARRGRQKETHRALRACPGCKGTGLTEEFQPRHCGMCAGRGKL